MKASPLKRDFLWFTLGLVFLAVSGSIYLYDTTFTDEELLSRLQNDIEADFQACVDAYNDTEKEVPAFCEACQLTYFNGRLLEWTNSKLLPSQEYIGRSNDIPRQRVVSLGTDRIYYQLLVRRANQTVITLIPIYIDYQVSNDFLTPYVFLGRYAGTFSGESLRTLSIGGPFKEEALNFGSENHILVDDASENLIFTMDFIPVQVLRYPSRLTVLITLLLGIFALFISLRYYLIDAKYPRRIVNASFIPIILLARMLVYWLELPGNYVQIELFSPNIMAFHDLAPSLGEFSLNIVTVASIIWLLYQVLNPLLNLYYRRWQRHPVISTALALCMLVATTFLIKLYFSIFRVVTINSQIELEFSNIFKTSIYSYLILVDVGLLLFAVALLLFMLLKFNVLLSRRYHFHPLFWVAHLAALALINVYLSFPSNSYISTFQLIGFSLLGISMFYWVVHRFPWRNFQQYDITNHVIVVGAISILVTFNIIAGVELNNQVKIEGVAKQVLERQIIDAILGFGNTTGRLRNDQSSLYALYEERENQDKFTDWLKEQYIAPNFRSFKVDVYTFDWDENKARIYSALDIPEVGVSQMLIDREAEGQDTTSLYRIEGFQGRDSFLGEFPLTVDDQRQRLVIRLIPADINAEGLYPALRLDKEIYEDLKTINSFDYALYRNGVLLTKNGETSFPIQLTAISETYARIKTSFNRKQGAFMEYVSPDDRGQVAIVRYQKQSFLNILTTLSIVFYIFTIGALIFIALPLLLIRALTGKLTFNIPLRSKIRLGLLGMSILPLILIVAFLYPFVEDRYEKQTEAELKRITKEIKRVVEFDFVMLERGRQLVRDNFQQQFKRVADLSIEDINVYDRDGKLLASTQDQIFESGIATDLMNSKAYRLLKDGSQAELVHKEQIGNLSFFSSYLPILGDDNLPAGYINVPYLGKQDQLNERVLDFIAYLVNIYLLVFLLFNFFAVFVSNTITQSLRLIQRSIAGTELGNVNKPIEYKGNDEIGGIVAAYNRMLEQLSQSEEKLKQSQRELAWKQMARQVAHEIKNPLTPMRLSIQHLNRAWNDNHSQLQTMFPRMVKTLLSQIDQLTRIANSFSEFAKLPDPVKSRTSVNEILLEVIDLYAQSEEAEWLIDIPERDYWANIDRDQLGRCFQNIIKNGLQAIESNGIMRVALKMNGNGMCQISIRDNGKGMSEEVQEKLFQPNFSTKSSGMGLGLAMVKRMIENSGGSIDFESRLDEGTTFFIELPVMN